ncbi:inositol monophosphatase family protein [Corynebacterium sphenisci]|uniref:inositol monophosphatase family protein n=1 Tax=Corynebacterium sphenisci TaxID=191493 RepID=UPI0026DED780|nr:inositol monophosphatase family protein [Corynebacterium sphenisci]MDO5731700.1 inositol monophosphatase family protein [Corynebacterium sphenisci]
MGTSSQSPDPATGAGGADPARLRGIARLLATAAADLVRRRRAELGAAGLRAGAATKSTASDPVTAVDRESEGLIRELLAALRPGEPILGEEGGGPTGAGAGPGVTWVVDPIDGTVNFLYGIPAYGVSVAAEIEGAAVAGAVADVAGGRVFHAARGAGAAVDLADGSSRPLACAAPRDLGTSLVATGFGYAADRRAAQATVLAALLPEVRDIRRVGSAALDLCLLAAGAVDCFYEHGLNRWDYSAGALIAAEAGAEVALPRSGSPVVAAAPSVAPAFRAALAAAGGAGPLPGAGG